MIKKIKEFFAPNKSKAAGKYNGFSDFFLHSSPEEKINVFTEAARRANEDQLKTYRKAQVKNQN